MDIRTDNWQSATEDFVNKILSCQGVPKTMHLDAHELFPIAPNDVVNFSIEILRNLTANFSPLLGENEAYILFIPFEVTQEFPEFSDYYPKLDWDGFEPPSIYMATLMDFFFFKPEEKVHFKADALDGLNVAFKSCMENKEYPNEIYNGASFGSFD